MDIDISVESDDWASLDVLQKISERALHAAANHCEKDMPADAEVSLVFHDDAGVQNLNKDWRKLDKPTNVLSFAANEGGGPLVPMLGDIILARQTIEREALEQGKAFDDHLAHLLIHGFLHLLGYDHINDQEADEMEALEIKILATLKITNPYEDTELNVSNIAE